MHERPENVIPITSQARSAAEKFRAEHDRELLTILFTDLVDSTKLQSDLGNVEAARLTELHRNIVRDELAKYDAREIEWAGDSCLAVFKRPSDAVVFALRMQLEHRRVRETETKLPLVRVGMHLGEIVVKKGDKKEDLFGLQVSESARVMSVARGNQIFCTRVVFDNARGVLKGSAIDGAGDIVWVNYGAYILKGFKEAVELCEVGCTDTVVLRAPIPTDKCQPALPSLLRETIGPTFSRSMADPGHVPLQERNPVRRFSVNLDPAAPIVGRLAISPDGSHLVYTAYIDGSTKLVSRRLDQLEGQPMQGTEGARYPFFSPDGQWIGFFTQPGRKLKKVLTCGGVPLTVCDASNVYGASWGDNDFIVFASEVGGGLLRVSAAGGNPEALTMPKTDSDETGHWLPCVLPGSNAVLFTVANGYGLDNMRIAVLSLETQEHRILAEHAAFPHYAPSGHAIYVQAGSLTAVPFDAESLRVTGPPVSMTESRMFPQGQATTLALSDEGTLVYRPGPTTPVQTRSLMWVDRRGKEEPAATPQGHFTYPRLSPDGTRVALTIADHSSADIWIYDLTDNTVARLTFGSGFDILPIWTPDGQKVVYASTREHFHNLYWKAVDGTGSEERLTSDKTFQYPHSWSPDCKILLYTERSRDAGWEIKMLSPDGEFPPAALLHTAYDECFPTLSSDGRWIAYQSNETGRDEIYVQPFPHLGGKWQISTNGGQAPSWGSDTRELFYLQGENMMLVSIQTDPAFTSGKPELLFERQFRIGPEHDRSYDISPDGQRFLMTQDDDQERGDTELIIVQNWFNELRRLAPAGGKN